MATIRTRRWRFLPLLFAAAAAACGKATPTGPGGPGGGTVPTSVVVTANPVPVDLPNTVQASATVQPAGAPQAVTWSSSDPTIATVNQSGLVTTLLVGSATITATSATNTAVSGSVAITIACPAPRVVSANITADTRWENWIPDPVCFDYTVSAALILNDETLTIEAGTVVGFGAGLGLRVRGTAGLVAAGTAADPILLTGTTKQRGFWGGVALESTFPEHILTHVTIEYPAGIPVSGTERAALIVNEYATARIEHSTFRQSQTRGIFLDREVSIPGQGNNTYTENLLGPAYAYGSSVEYLLQGGSTITGNDTDVVTVYPEVISDQDLWSAGVFHVIRVSPENFRVTGGLELGPGVTIRFDGDQSMRILSDGALTAVGTAASPVVITGSAAVPGHWRGLAFTDTDNAANRLDYVVIEYGGGNGGISGADPANLMIARGATRVSVSNTTLRGSIGYGLYVRQLSRLTNFTGNSMTGNAMGPASLDGGVIVDLMPSNNFIGNPVAEITVNATIMDRTSATDGVWHDFGVPYFIKRFNSQEWPITGLHLQIEPGVEMLFGPGVGMSLLAGASLVAEGTVLKPILFDAMTTPWKGLDFSDGTGSFDHATIRNGGSHQYGLVQAAGNVIIRTAGAGPPSSHVTFTGNVTLTGAPHTIVFGYGDTYATGCIGSVYIPPPDQVSDHCVP